MRKFVFVVLLSLSAHAAAKPPVVGALAPAFTVTSFDGRQLALADLRGKVVVLNFWATRCIPCRKELPLLDSYYKIRRDAGLEVVAVTAEDSVPIQRL